MRAQLLIALLLGCSTTERPSTLTAPAQAATATPEAAPAPAQRLPVDPAWLAAFADAESAQASGEDRAAYVQVDRPLYQPGDTVWVKTWSLDKQSLGEREGEEQGLRYRLVDPRGSVAVEKWVQETHGTANNDLAIPPGAVGGVWTVVMMPTLGPQVQRPVIVAGYEPPRVRKELEFEREGYGPGDEVTATVDLLGPDGEPMADMPVVSQLFVDGQRVPVLDATSDEDGVATLRFVLPAAIERPDGVLTVQVDAGGITEAISRPVPIVLSRLSVDFYPEGGDLVVGLPSRVYFRALDAYDQPADVVGRVVDDLGRPVARLKSLHDGMGRFEFTPRPGRTYHLTVEAPQGVDGVHTLPGALSEGCVLRSYDDLDGEVDALRVGVRCAPARQVVVMSAQRQQILDKAAVLAGPDEDAAVYLEDAERRQGVAQVTLLDVTLTPLAERLVYRNRARGLQVSITPTRDDYAPRDEVVLNVKTLDADGEPVSAELALSVVDDAVLKFADDEEGHLVSAMYLEHALTEPVKDPGWYFDEDEADAAAGLDMLMGTKGWRRFERQQRLSGAEAKREEGKVGKQSASLDRAQGNKVEMNKAQLDKQIAEAAGVLGQLRDGSEFDGVFGASGLSSDIVGGIGGLIGASGGQLGAGGLGARGSGLGGGGTADSLGGLGLKGRGSGASGYGTGGGGFGAKGSGGVGRIGGDPIILGALDKSLIDAVVKRNMNQLRYCYQRELTKNPQLGGKVVVKFVIAPDGSISSAATKSSTMNSPAVEQCINSRFQRFQFPQPKGGGVVIVSYPFLFSADGAGSYGQTYTPPTPEYAVVREFPAPRYTGEPVEERTDFRQTVMWAPEVTTGTDGAAQVRFHLSDAVTTFKVVAEGVGRGLVGRVEHELSATTPFELRTRLPDAVSEGDSLLLPVTLANHRADALSVDLSLDTPSDLLTIGRTDPVQIAGGDATTVTVPVTVTGVTGEADITVLAAFGQRSERVKRSLTVVPRGFPRTWSASGAAGDEPVTHAIDVGDVREGTQAAQITLYPTALADMMQGLDGMARSPSGCFEQTSSANYPNVMILTYLADKSGVDPSLVARISGYLDSGYKKLVGYESPSGGFDWWGRDPGHEELTAYGLLQFTDMSRVYQVDRSMMARVSDWLTRRRDGDGNFVRADKAMHRFGRTSGEVSSAYLTWGLVSAGQPDLSVELAARARTARTTDDPYLLSLSALALLGAPDRRLSGMEAAQRLPTFQREDGSWTTSSKTITDSGEADRAVETTALATLALIGADGNPEAITAAGRWLRAQRRGDGTWGATQATVLALKAVVALEGYVAANRGDGEVRVTLNGQDVGTISYRGDGLEPVRYDLPAGLLHDGENHVTLTHSGELPIPYALGVRAQVETPPSSPLAALDVETSLSRKSVDVGDTVRMTVTVKNLLDDTVSSPLLRIGLPAGARAQTWQLEQLVERGAIAAFETRPREVTLYLDGMMRLERKTFALDLSADVPGEFTGPASSAYLYYDDAHKDWEGGLALAIKP